MDCYYLIFKTDKKMQSEKPILFTGGYSFAKKTKITLYNRDMMNYVLTKKLNKSLKNIIALYLECVNGEDESGEAQAQLAPQIELMRSVLLEKYSFFMDRKTVESYLNKLDKMERKAGNLAPRKSRSM